MHEILMNTQLNMHVMQPTATGVLLIDREVFFILGYG